LYVVGRATSFLIAILVDQKSTVITDTFAPSPVPIGLLNIQVVCLDDSIQLWVMLYPTLAWLIGWAHTRKVVVILLSIEVHSAVRVLAG
jgi:hypothetical protein